MNYDEILSVIRQKVPFKVDTGIVLGSGLGFLAEEIVKPIIIPYENIPYFPHATVPGHRGRMFFGQLSGKSVLCMQGRCHYYEGYRIHEITLPIRIMKKMGLSSLFVTNAAGAVNKQFEPGDLMVIEDHINLMSANPLRGPNDGEFGPRFPDMTEAYDGRLRKIAFQVAHDLGIKIRKGVYAALDGPTYDTPAEVRYYRSIGIDAVGMSTVPEVIVANHAGLKTLGISCIANMAAGISPNRMDHHEVIATTSRVKDQFSALIKGVLATI
jgi:purine-nucleoside phosphorylase